ncbi:hypothetical protein GCM10022393_39900 [Aquimarina addita]|uniref:Uncharacterized protein n=1 Tax=Aquimarina addita TaxID=870485 RepID=A0ABP6UX36_9FLAO
MEHSSQNIGAIIQSELKMTNRLKRLIGFITAGSIVIFGCVIFGLNLINDEDGFGDLIYFNQKVENGDIIFRCVNNKESGLTTDFNEFGIIEKSSRKVYIWDNQNTMKRDLYQWAEKGNSKKVKVMRIKDPNFDINKIKLINGNYNYLINSDKLEFIIKNY